MWWVGQGLEIIDQMEGMSLVYAACAEGVAIITRIYNLLHCSS
jgi:hypothetical protein